MDAVPNAVKWASQPGEQNREEQAEPSTPVLRYVRPFPKLGVRTFVLDALRGWWT